MRGSRCGLYRHEGAPAGYRQVGRSLQSSQSTYLLLPPWPVSPRVVGMGFPRLSLLLKPRGRHVRVCRSMAPELVRTGFKSGPDVIIYNSYS